MHVVSAPILAANRHSAPRVDDDEPPVNLFDLCCSECEGELIWHQPDPGRPARLLGACSECGGWHLFDEAAGGGVVFTSIPHTFEAGARARR